MLLGVRHRTEYLYDGPVRESVMELWLQPQQSAAQRLLDFALDLDPAAQLFSYADSFGNAVYHFDVPQAHQRLVIVSTATVETAAPALLPERLDAAEWERLKSTAVSDACFDYLRPHGLAAPTPALDRFMAAHAIPAAPLGDPLSAARSASHSLYQAIDYEKGITRADSPIDHALEAGRGVCQDFAHVMIAICRQWGLPARYVSGYLYADAGLCARSDPAATHAWVEVFLPSLGWIGLDPTNDIAAGERHIILAVGRDYADVPPSRGVYKGGAESALSVAVTVRPTSAAAFEPEFVRTARPALSSSGRRLPSAAALGQLLQQQQQ